MRMCAQSSLITNGRDDSDDGTFSRLRFSFFLSLCRCSNDEPADHPSLAGLKQNIDGSGEKETSVLKMRRYRSGMSCQLKRIRYVRTPIFANDRFLILSARATEDCDNNKRMKTVAAASFHLSLSLSLSVSFVADAVSSTIGSIVS